MCERMVSTLEQAIWEELAEGMANILGDKLEAVILYGSYARGTQDAESDIDIALILCGKPGRNTTDRLQDFLTDVNNPAQIKRFWTELALCQMLLYAVKNDPKQ